MVNATLNAGYIIAIIVGVLIILALVAYFVIAMLENKKRIKEAEDFKANREARLAERKEKIKEYRAAKKANKKAK